MNTERGATASCSLNHFYAVVDSATYRAMEGDAFLRRAFAPNERRTTVRTDQTYTGLYFYGVNTYFEVFDVADSGGRAVGDYGLAFGVDEVGGISALCKRVGPDLGSEPELITRLYEGQQLPWFFMASLTHFPLGSAHSSWVMEYHPDFLSRWHPRSLSHAGVRRREILARYRDVLGERVVDPILVNVIGLTIAANLATRQHLASFCSAAGYGVETAGTSIDLHGPDLVVHLLPSNGTAEGIGQVEMRTQREPSNVSEQHFGRSTLRFTPGRATLIF